MKSANIQNNTLVGTLRYPSLLLVATMTGTITCYIPVAAAEKKSLDPITVDYNPSFIHGSGVDILRFSHGNPILPGEYEVKVWVNGSQRGKEKIKFVIPANQSSAEACLSAEQLKRLGITADSDKQKVQQLIKQDCLFLKQWVGQSSSHYNSGDFELNLRVPQINLIELPRGYIDASLWQSSETAGFIDYSGNAYAQFQGRRRNTDPWQNYSGSMQMVAGFNYGQWRIRKRISANWITVNSLKTQNLYGYMARDITPLQSELVLGETNTSGDLFDGFSLRGVMLRSDERMLPDSLRSYSPVLRGIAETNARVTVKQRGSTIYETVVPPGPFKLSDIGTMGWGGDLQMIVTEADGRQRIENIPFSAPPKLLHAGISNFSFLAGELKDEQASTTPRVVQGSYRYGVNNLWTVYAGGQYTEQYRAYGVGSAFNLPIGGVSFNVIHADTRLQNHRRESGNSYQINYSKYLDQSDTNLTLSAYRYTTSGFYTFRESALYRDKQAVPRIDHDMRTRHRLSASVSQRLTDSMSLWFNGSLFTYWGGRGDSRQYSLTFNHGLPRFSYGVTIMRTLDQGGSEQNSLLLSLSVPLGTKTQLMHPLFNSMYASASRSSGGISQLQTQATGSQGYQSQITYGVGATAANTPNQEDRSVNGNINYRSGYGQFGVTGSVNNHQAQQLSVSAAGSVVAHAGGVTVGPALGDAPFAIIHAKGAQGARLLNAYGGRIDRYGYAIMPSLTPYRENSVQLDPHNLPSDVDVLENESIVVPRQSAAIMVEMATVSGTPRVLMMRDSRGQPLPIGSEVQVEKGNSAIVGQGGQAFIRGWQPADQRLEVTIDNSRLTCKPSQTPAMPLGTSQIIRMEVVCQE